MKKFNIGILTFPIGKAGCIATSNLVEILYTLSNDLHIITGNEGYTFFKDDGRIHTYNIYHKKGSNIITRFLRYIFVQLKMSYKIALTARHIDIWIFFIGGDALILPMLTAKLLRKKVAMASAGSSSRSAASSDDIYYPHVEILSNINYKLSNHIILYSPHFIKDLNLEKYSNKISIASEHILDLNKFKIKKAYSNRNNLVGYIGRLSVEKGVFEFVQSIPILLKEKENLNFLIGGDGELRENIKLYLEKNDLLYKIKLAGWIPHEKLPEYLNDLKFVVLPSHTEGLPNIMLESMACGTPVLATPVGAIKDVIKDGLTGFILMDNSPEYIAKSLNEALNHPDLGQIIKNARALVEKEFTHDAAVNKYKKIIEKL